MANETKCKTCHRNTTARSGVCFVCQNRVEREEKRRRLALCVNCGSSFGTHSLQQTLDCANARS